MKPLGVFLLPPGWDASPLQPKVSSPVPIYIYTWVERGTVRVNCLAQGHNIMSPARTRTWAALSALTMRPTSLVVVEVKILVVKIEDLRKNSSDREAC